MTHGKVSGNREKPPGHRLEGAQPWDVPGGRACCGDRGLVISV